MKNIFKIFITFFVICLVIVACNLERLPYNSIILSESFESVKDANAWKVKIYDGVRGSWYGDNMSLSDVQADQLNASLEFGNRKGSIHRWGSYFLADDQNVAPIWTTYYSSLTNINIFLERYKDVETKDEKEKDDLSVSVGEVYLARAYYYSLLIRRFAKPYSDETKSELGVPLILEYDVELRPERATIGQVYEQILADLKLAETALSNVEGVRGASTFTIDVVKALQARTKLYMQDWDGAIKDAESVINSGMYSLIDNAEELEKMWQSDLDNEVIFQSFVSKPNEILGSTNRLYLGYNANLKPPKYQPDFIPSKWVIDKYEEDDIRKQVYFKDLPCQFQGKDVTLTLINKYYGNENFFTTANTNYQIRPKLFRLAEMYLIVAEAKAENGNDAEAISTINILRTARKSTPLAGVSGKVLKDSIREERTRELAFEGFRLDDLKRWNKGIERKDPQDESIINTGVGFESLKIPADADKFVWPIPTNDIIINPNLKQNLGY